LKLYSPGAGDQKRGEDNRHIADMAETSSAEDNMRPSLSRYIYEGQNSKTFFFRKRFYGTQRIIVDKQDLTGLPACSKKRLSRKFKNPAAVSFYYAKLSRLAQLQHARNRSFRPYHRH
jgi:hypothetical protein